MRNREHIRPYEFSQEMKDKVKAEQQFMCGFCGRQGCLEIHHILPVAMGGDNSRRNAIALCPPDHELFNRLAFQENLLFPDVIMSEGLQYQIRNGKL